MNITVIGTGYVGLVSGACFAETGNSVTCVDIDKSKVQMLLGGKIPIYEPGLNVIYQRNLDQGRLKFTTNLEIGVSNAKVIVLALPTPPGEDGSADLSYILSVAKQLAPLIKSYTIVLDKSTVPVGTAKKVHNILATHCDTSLFDVVSNPEFLREGVAVNDFMKPERIVIGTNSDKAKSVMQELYQPFVMQGNPIIYMNEESAEITKYAANAFLATKISFMNEIANISERVGANVDSVRKALGADSRIGKRFLFSGVGYGGSCFPKDVLALKHTSNSVNYDFKILSAVVAVNDKQRLKVYEKLKTHFQNNLSNKRIAIWGLSFKPNTDDIREAPSIYTIEMLLKDKCQICVFDPAAMENVKIIYGSSLQFANNQYDVLRDADALLIMTEWSVFRTPDYSKMKALMNKPLIVDGRNVFDPTFMRENGFEYHSIGRP